MKLGQVVHVGVLEGRRSRFVEFGSVGTKLQQGDRKAVEVHGADRIGLCWIRACTTTPSPSAGSPAPSSWSAAEAPPCAAPPADVVALPTT
ncbi:hypothetical protein ACFQZC_37300 [Streptacidiphilus monticola]